jgi:hypothetical protein
LLANILHYSPTLTLFGSPYFFYLLTVGVEVICFHLITLRHTPQSVGPLWTRDRPLPNNTTTHKRETSMPPVGFEHTITASPRPQTYALDRAATGIGPHTLTTDKFSFASDFSTELLLEFLLCSLHGRASHSLFYACNNVSRVYFKGLRRVLKVFVGLCASFILPLWFFSNIKVSYSAKYL